jgi:hypothetical protein
MNDEQQTNKEDKQIPQEISFGFFFTVIIWIVEVCKG